MSEHMGVVVELWTVAADEAGIWLVGKDAWRGGRVMADDTVQHEMEMLAYRHVPDLPLSVTHSPSWRQEGPHCVLTFVAIVQAGEHIQDRWPNALPLTTALLDLVGKPRPHAANEAPVPRYIDVLMHTVRHLRFLRDTDDPIAAAMTAEWHRHLEEFEPELGGLYHTTG